MKTLIALRKFVFCAASLYSIGDLYAVSEKRPDPLAVVRTTANVHRECNGTTTQWLHSSVMGQIACLVGVNAVGFAGFVKDRRSHLASAASLAKASIPMFSFSIAF